MQVVVLTESVRDTCLARQFSTSAHLPSTNTFSSSHIKSNTHTHTLSQSFTTIITNQSVTQHLPVAVTVALVVSVLSLSRSASQAQVSHASRWVTIYPHFKSCQSGLHSEVIVVIKLLLLRCLPHSLPLLHHAHPTIVHYSGLHLSSSTLLPTATDSRGCPAIVVVV